MLDHTDVVLLDIEVKRIQQEICRIKPFTKTTLNIDNPRGSILQMTLCVAENEITQEMIRYFESLGIESILDMYDGIVVL